MTERQANGELDLGNDGDTSRPEAEKDMFADSKPPPYDGPPTYNKPPSQVVHVAVTGKPPESYLWLSIITLFFFCWIFGLIALLKSAQVKNMWYAGQPEQARRLAQSSKRWNIAGIACGVVLTVVAFIIFIPVYVVVQVTVRRAIVAALTSNSTDT